VRRVSHIALFVSLAWTYVGCIDGIAAPSTTLLASVNATTFTMGGIHACSDGDSTLCDSASIPSITVELAAYGIEFREVTNAQYRHCVSRGFCVAPSYGGIEGAADYYRDEKYAAYPMVNITWSMARQYCHAIGRRLPNEAEWELAARYRSAGDLSKLPVHPWGNGEWDCNKAHTAECTNDGLPKGTGATLEDISELSVQDLAGNVAEWVEDIYDPFANCEGAKSYAELCADDATCMNSKCSDDGDSCLKDCDGEQPLCRRAQGSAKGSNGNGAGELRSIRGGSYRLGKCAAVATYRAGLDPELPYPHVGFRCAR
jgi:formylglycine-generating enzyme required for sulfatase activity